MFYVIESIRKLESCKNTGFQYFIAMTNSDLHSKESVAARLIAVRTHLGYNQVDFAKEVGVAVGQINDWESARARVSLQGALKIYERFKVDLNFLFLNDLDRLPHNMAVALSSKPENK